MLLAKRKPCQMQAVSTADGKGLADELGAHFLEASAKTGAAVEVAFLALAADIKARSGPPARTGILETPAAPCGPARASRAGTDEPVKARAS